MSETPAAEEARFWEVNRQWQRGELTRGEAPSLLGMGLFDYEARLRQERVMQEREPEAEENARRALEIIRATPE